MKKRQETIEDKLKRYSKLDPDTGCLIWIGSKNGKYGDVWIQAKRKRCAHVVAWECVHGPRPEGFIIRRTCGEKRCINVQHMVLFNASAAEDDIEWLLDRLKKGVTVNHSTHCWEWQEYKTSRGYGIIRVGKHNVRAHRMMWKCVNGETKGLQVLHRCDNPSCINPKHLFLGTHADNMQDRLDKNRYCSKLNRKAVQDIRISKLSPKKLAEKYGVGTWVIYAVLRRRTWKHVE